jgi:hypothetical protein
LSVTDAGAPETWSFSVNQLVGVTPLGTSAQPLSRLVERRIPTLPLGKICKA